MDREVRTRMNGLKTYEQRVFHFVWGRERGPTKCTSCRAQRSEPKRTTATLSLNPTALRTKLLKKHLLHPHPRHVVENRKRKLHSNGRHWADRGDTAGRVGHRPLTDIEDRVQ